MNSVKLREAIKRSDSLEVHESKLSKVLLDDRPRRKNQKRFMSLHVGSRWYRAPEISIIEK